MKSNLFKYCAVPRCPNNTVNTPEKLFIHVPRLAKFRKKWLRLAGLPVVVTKSKMHFCEDHFDLPNDMKNYTEYRLMGSVSQVRLKQGCLPSKFACQPGWKNTDKVPKPLPAKVKEKKEFKREMDDAHSTQSTSVDTVANDAILQRANVNLSCFACLSTDRTLKPLQHMSLVALVCPELFLNATVTTHYLICWECQAMVVKIKEFQAKVCKAHSLLQQTGNAVNNYPYGLTNLKITGIETIAISPKTDQEAKVTEPVPKLPQIKTEIKSLKEEIPIEDTDFRDYDELIEPISIYQMSSSDNKNTVRKMEVATSYCDTAVETKFDISAAPSTDPISSKYAVQKEMKRKQIDTEIKCNTPKIKKIKDTPKPPKFRMNIKGSNYSIASTVTPRGVKEQVKVTVGEPKGVPKKDITKVVVPVFDVTADPEIIVPDIDYSKECGLDVASSVGFINTSAPKMDTQIAPKATVPKEIVQKAAVVDVDATNTSKIPVPKVTEPDVSFPRVYLHRLAIPKDNAIPKTKTGTPKADQQAAGKPKATGTAVSDTVVPKVTVPEVIVPEVTVTNMGISKIQEEVKGNDDKEITCKLLNRSEMMGYRACKLIDYAFTRALYKCVKCLESFNSQEKLDAHNKIHDVERGIYVCEICEQRFPNGTMRDTHYKSHFVIYECVACALQSNDRLAISEHVCKPQQLSDVHCRENDAGSEQSQNAHKQPQNLDFVCDFCDKEFQFKTELAEHIHDTHMNGRSKAVNTCDVCSFSFTGTCILDHRNTQLGLKIKCLDCGDIK